MRIPYKVKLLKDILLKKSEGEKIIIDSYVNRFGVEPNIINPKRFSEKLCKRMVLLNRKSDRRYTHLVDKLLVREYVSSTIGDSYLTKLYWQGESPDYIPFGALPEKFVIKTNHGCGKNIIVTGSYNRSEIVLTLKKFLKDNFYWVAREYQYYGIDRKILIEEFLDDGYEDGPLDYKIWCFSGRPELIQIDNRAHDISLYYDANWIKQELSSRQNFKDYAINRPGNLDELMAVASSLASGMSFVRVDLYSISGQIRFGELTFTPGAGMFRFSPDRWDLILGEKWVTPIV